MPAKAVNLEGEQLLARFQALDAFLREHQSLWRPRPFTQLNMPWEAHHPELSQWLRQRSLHDAEASHNQPHQLGAPAPFTALAATALALSRLERLPGTSTCKRGAAGARA